MTDNIDLKKLIRKISTEIVTSIWSELKRVDIEVVEKSDGRKTNSHEACKNASFVYLLYSHDNVLLYVGETGVSIKSRLTGDGSGAHKNKAWYQEISYIKYCRQKIADLNEPERKIIEESITLVKNPLYYR